jgi:hypothetical protein
LKGTAFSEVGQVQWTADAAAILIAGKLRSFNAATIIEKAVGRRRCSAIVFTERTMPLIRTALGNHSI